MRIREFFKSIPVVYKTFSKIRAAYRGYVKYKMDPARRLRRIFSNRQEVSIVQIGSNDGNLGDPIYSLLSRHHTWKALLVEPVPFLFERLRQTYAGHLNCRFDNVAIGAQNGVSRFYYVDPAAKEAIPDLPPWYDQLGSFDPNHIKKHFGNRVDEFILTEDILTVPLSILFERNGIDKIDILHIDTEGYDWIILKQLDLNKYSPEVILVEHVHLSDSSKEELQSFLNRSYKISDYNGDYFCRRIN